MGENGNARRTDFWRGAFISLVTAVVVLLGGWMTVGNKLITKTELKETVGEQVALYVAEHDEYRLAKKSIDDRLGRAANLEGTLTTVLTQQASANTKLDAIIDRLTKLEERSR